MQSMTDPDANSQEVYFRLHVYISSVASIVVAHFFRATVQIICGMRASEVRVVFSLVLRLSFSCAAHSSDVPS